VTQFAQGDDAYYGSGVNALLSKAIYTPFGENCLKSSSDDPGAAIEPSKSANWAVHWEPRSRTGIPEAICFLRLKARSNRTYLHLLDAQYLNFMGIGRHCCGYRCVGHSGDAMMMKVLCRAGIHTPMAAYSASGLLIFNRGCLCRAEFVQ
jgi:hypothetical protein